MNCSTKQTAELRGVYMAVPEGQPPQVSTGELWPRVIQASAIELSSDLIGRRLRVRAIGERGCEVLGLA